MGAKKLILALSVASLAAVAARVAWHRPPPVSPGPTTSRAPSPASTQRTATTRTAPTSRAAVNSPWLRECPGLSPRDILSEPASVQDARVIRVAGLPLVDMAGGLWITDPLGPGSADQAGVIRTPRVPATVFRSGDRTITLEVQGDSLVARASGVEWMRVPCEGMEPGSLVAFREGVAFIRRQGSERRGVIVDLQAKDVKTTRSTPGQVRMSVDAGGLTTWDSIGTSRPQRCEKGKLEDVGQPPGADAVMVAALPDGAMITFTQGVKGVSWKLDAGQRGPTTRDVAGEVKSLLDRLADNDPVVRESAVDALVRMGPSAWETLRAGDATGEAARVIDLLKERRDRVPLRGLSPRGNVVLLGAKPDSGILLHCAEGFENEDQTLVGHLVRIAPGGAVRPVPRGALGDDGPAAAQIVHWKDGLLVAKSPWRVFDGMDWLELPDMRGAKEFVGRDAGGRLVFSGDAAGWVLEPRLRAEHGRLAVWAIDAGVTEVGRDARGHAAVEREGTWILEDEGWVAGQATDRGDTPAPLRVSAPEPGKPTDLGGSKWVAGELAIQGEVSVTVTEDEGYAISFDGDVARLRLRDGTWHTCDAWRVAVPGGDIRGMWVDPAGRVCVRRATGLSVLFPDAVVPRKVWAVAPESEMNFVANEAAGKAQKKAP